jgi:hypothetical protein
MGGGVRLQSGYGKLEYSKRCHFYFFLIFFKYIFNTAGSMCLLHKELFSWSMLSKTRTERRTLLGLLEPCRRAQRFVPQAANLRRLISQKSKNILRCGRSLKLCISMYKV